MGPRPTNLLVPQGAKCTPNGTRVEGTVKVERGAQLENGREGGSGRVLNSKVNGGVQYFTNEARMVARGNTILGNLQANQNTGGLVISNNSIVGNLQCQANNPRPTGGGNTAGDKEDQRAAL